jgi:hypothetical protein
MFKKLTCPYHFTNKCATYDSLIFFDNHGNYDGNDYFLPKKYREHYRLIKENDLANKEIIKFELKMHDFEFNGNNYFLADNIFYDKIMAIDNFEMQFEKQIYYDSNNAIIFDPDYKTENMTLYNKEIKDDFRIDELRELRYRRQFRSTHTCISKYSYEFRTWFNFERWQTIYNKSVYYLFMLNSKFSSEIFENYICYILPKFVPLIKLFVGSTRYIIRNIRRRNYFFMTMKNFNIKYRKKAKENEWKKRLLAAKPYIPSKYRKENSGNA